ncbi:MAG: hypothetical protein Q8Q73_14755 [Stagnimonas sp.]|nr:hypothetical protein [Stagnimonas sp.]
MSKAASTPPVAAPGEGQGADTGLRDTELLDKLEQEAAGAESPPPPPPEGEVSTGQLVGMILGPGFAILAPNWKVTDAEIDQLGKLYGALLDKYVPDLKTAYGLEISAVLVTAAVIGPRLMVPRHAEPKKDAPAPAADARAG